MRSLIYTTWPDHRSNFLYQMLRLFIYFSCVGGQLSLDGGQTLHLNTTEPSAVVEDSKGNKRHLTMSMERKSFINHHGREWEYGVAWLVVEKNITFNANSNVKISGENALSIASATGNIVIKTNIVLSCDLTVPDGKCVGGYFYISGNKPKWLNVIPGKFILVCF